MKTIAIAARRAGRLDPATAHTELAGACMAFRAPAAKAAQGGSN